MTLFACLQKRERGLRCQFGDSDRMLKSVYTAIGPYTTWNNKGYINDYGAVYNVEFSPDSSILIAACEKKALVLFDPVTHRQAKAVKNAHQDCVTCIKFIDSNAFATGSDDSTIAIWDLRNLSKKLRSLNGHKNWVKNIEYVKKDSLLVSSSFDGSVFTWDLKSPTEHGYVCTRVFRSAGLMRCRITPDETKLIICTTGGYFILIHDLDLTTLARDLNGFQPNLYRLMQVGQQVIPYAAQSDRVFTKHQLRNRVELVDDFPNSAEIISSLQIHPHGWCALSRNVSFDEKSEWTCVHDIQDTTIHNDDAGKDEEIVNFKYKHYLENRKAYHPNFRLHHPEAEQLEESPRVPQDNVPHDIWEAEIALRERSQRADGRRDAERSSFANMNVVTYNSGITMTTDSPIPPPLSNPPSTQEPQAYGNIISSQVKTARVVNNQRRMTHYIQDSCKGKGYIKELCFSSDGRIIASPFECGIRLLGFSKDCSEMPNSMNPTDSTAQKLVELKFIKTHTDTVVCTRFSPKLPIIATGCLKGKVVWYLPKF